MEYDWAAMFENSMVNFTIHHPAVSQQNSQDKKIELKKKIKETTSLCPYIITENCYIQIIYYCSHIKRCKNHGMYDIDNVIKPILDSLVGLDGIIIDDSVFNGVSINWIDHNSEDSFDISIESHDLNYEFKSELLILKQNNWCFPVSSKISDYWLNEIKSYLKNGILFKQKMIITIILKICHVQDLSLIIKLKTKNIKYLI